MKPAPAPTTASGPKRVLIVDDHPFMRRGLADALNHEPGLTVCGEAASAEAGLDAVKKLRPDVVITDLTMPGKGGLEFIKDLAALWPGLPVLALSMHEEDVYAERCLRAGAKGYLMKSDGPERLLDALRQVLAGKTCVSNKVLDRMVRSFTGKRGPERPLGRLTDREFEVFELLGMGKTAGEIARQLHLSTKTVDTHRANILRKLELGRATELLTYAVRWVESGGK